MDRQYCLSRYCRSWLLLDVVSTVPWEMIIASSHETGLLRLCKVRRSSW
jgi:hypothetical protein